MMTRDHIIARWQSLATREKSILLGGTTLLVLIVIYLLLEPELERRARMQNDIPRLREDLAWMQSQLPELQRLTGTNAGQPTGAPLSIALVEDLLRQSGIHDRVSELRPVDGSVSLRFEEVSHAGLMQFLSVLTTRSTVRIAAAGIRRLESAGNVEASLTLKSDSAP